MLSRKTLSRAQQHPKKPELTSSSLNRSAWVMSFSLMLLKEEKGSCSGEGPPCEYTQIAGLVRAGGLGGGVLAQGYTNEGREGDRAGATVPR